MARKKNPPRGVEVFWPLLWGVVLLLIAALAVAAAVLGLRILASAPMFSVRAIHITESLQPLECAELQKLKGKNIFKVDLDKAESRIRTKYPAIADLRVMRRYPDEIHVAGIRREAFAVAVIDGRQHLVDRNGYLITMPGPGDKGVLDAMPGRGPLAAAARFAKFKANLHARSTR